jgi:mono/diheme cytochrome c family protein
VPGWIHRERLPRSARAGALLFAQIGCLNCHTYLGTGGGFKGAPDLSAEGRKHRGIQWQSRHLRCPSCVVRGSPMPRFDALGAKRIRQIAIFLEASKGSG